MSTTAMPADGGGITCSVCIANYNGMDLIDACIDSVRTQDCGFVVEIIVHDDASTDDSAAHIAARHPDVRLIASRDNAGFCVANNRMAAAAKGEYLLLLNNDAALHPGALATLMQEAMRLRPINVIAAFDPQFYNFVPKLFPHMSSAKDWYEMSPDKGFAAGQMNATLGAAYFIIAARAIGIDCGPMSGFDNGGLDKGFLKIVALSHCF